MSLLLEVDREYRQKAEAGMLPTVAPRRFNPTAAAWLPFLHTRPGRWMLTALYSNTARAHRLGRLQDWVVITYHTDQSAQGQCTVVTELQGAMAGQRVVRGRENEDAEQPETLQAVSASPPPGIAGRPA